MHLDFNNNLNARLQVIPWVPSDEVTCSTKNTKQVQFDKAYSDNINHHTQETHNYKDLINLNLLENEFLPNELEMNFQQFLANKFSTIKRV
jgi:hypothetical protein